MRKEIIEDMRKLTKVIGEKEITIDENGFDFDGLRREERVNKESEEDQGLTVLEE